MIIEKRAIEEKNFRLEDYYYKSAREGMFDLLQNMVVNKFINTLFLPGYIGWSPREGSGIFDPIKKIKKLNIRYYKMTSELNIDYDDLIQKIDSLVGQKIAVLIVNYFGFVDPQIKELSKEIKKRGVWIIEDNAHGFFTFHKSESRLSDATFFSLHKMFPIENGGSLRIFDTRLKELKYSGEKVSKIGKIPWLYDIDKIANCRRKNYKHLQKLINENRCKKYFKPLKSKLGKSIVPQTFPIVIMKGDRNIIYELMNKSGYGVVSLYHTLIEPLRNKEYKYSNELSKNILNLPIHQDVDTRSYKNMITKLIEFCKSTKT